MSNQDLGIILGNVVSDQQSMKQSLPDQSVTPAWVQQFSGNITPEHRTTITWKNIPNGSTLFWASSSTQTEAWHKWSSSTVTNGNWASTKVDSYSTYREVQRVTNWEDTYEQYFETSTLIDSTNSTGTGDYSTNYNYTIDAGQTLQSDIIAKNNQAYTRGTLTLTGTGTSTARLYLSFNGGTNWQSVTNGTEVIASSTTVDGIKYKVEAPSGTQFGVTGLAFPISFAGGSSTLLTKVEVQYS